MNKLGEILVTLLSITTVILVWCSFDNEILHYTIWAIGGVYVSLVYLYVASKMITKGRMKAEREFNENQKPKTNAETKNPNFKIRKV